MFDWYFDLQQPPSAAAEAYLVVNQTAAVIIAFAVASCHSDFVAEAPIAPEDLPLFAEWGLRPIQLAFQAVNWQEETDVGIGQMLNVLVAAGVDLQPFVDFADPATLVAV
jgi:hypothetical protein